VLPGETEAVGTLRVSAYMAQDHLAANPAYADTLRALGQDGHGTILVAADVPEGADGSSGPGEKLLGTVMYEPWHPGSEVARSADEAEVRALAVAPWAQGRGVGRALMLAVIGAAETSGVSRLLLSTRPEMKAAQHLYRSLGFTRTPGLDWSPLPGITLLGFALPIRHPR
jgi:ribosomal protein S18 acetylase RimI-like enzyme